MTVPAQGQPASPADPQASLRVELTGRIGAAQSEIERAIAALRAAGQPVPSNAEAQLGSLIAMRQDIAFASASDLPALQQAVAAVLAAAGSTAQEAQAKGDAAAGQSAAELLGQASANARRAVDAVMGGMKDFEPYLKFASPEDERAYRERERERHEAIEREKAKHTPEGDLNAVKLAKAQLVDAGAHGADQNPEFATRWRTLDDAEGVLTSAMATKQPARSDCGTSPNHDRELAHAMAALNAAGVKGSPVANPDISHGLQAGAAACAARSL